MVELVIKIDDETYKEVKERTEFDTLSLGIKLIEAVQNGTPLPKGHGALIDRSKLLVELECGIRAGNYEEGYEKYPHINDMDDCFDTVKYADTIIEADKKYEAKVITRGNCMICGKELTEGLFFCKECENKSEQTDIEFNHKAFYEFLLNTINPNEMEKYRSMFLSSDEIVK